MVKSMKRNLLAICISICMLTLSLAITHASDYSDSNADSNAYENNNGVVIFPKGCRSRWSGFLVYIVDGDANLRSDIKVIASYTTLPEYNDPIIETRIGNGVVDLSSIEVYKGAVWGYPPFDSDGNACGGAIRDWMLAANEGVGYNMYSVLEMYFSEDNSNIVEQFVTNDWYLIVEPFFWFMYYHGYDASGYYICDTAKGIAETEKYINSVMGITGTDALYGAKNFRRYTNNNFPNCCRFLRSQFGIPVINEAGGIKSGLLTNDEIIENGYGIMSFWAGDLETDNNEEEDGPTSETTTTPESEDEYEYAVDERIDISEDAVVSRDTLYTIMNKAVSAEYDLSVGIPVEEYVKNYFEAYPVFFDTARDKLSIITRTVTRKENAIYTYRWPNMVVVETGSVWVENWQTCNACLGSGYIESGENYERNVCNNCGAIVKASEWGIECTECGGFGELRDIAHWHKPEYVKCYTCDGEGYIESGYEYYREQCSNSRCNYIVSYEYGYTGDSWGDLCFNCNGNPLLGYTPIKDRPCGMCDGEGYVCYDCGSSGGYTTDSYVQMEECSVCRGSGYGGIKTEGYYEDCTICDGIGIVSGGGRYYVCNRCGGKNPVFREKDCTNSECNDGWRLVPASESICEDCGGTGVVGNRYDPCDALGCENGIIKTKEYPVQCGDCKGTGTETYHNSTCDGSTKSLVIPDDVDCAECVAGKTDIWIEAEYYDCSNLNCEDGMVEGSTYYVYICDDCGYSSGELYSTYYTSGLYDECYQCYGSGIYGITGGEEIYCSICDGAGRLCEYCQGTEYEILKPDYERHGCMDCDGNFFCDVNGKEYCDGNHENSCNGTGLKLPPMMKEGYYDKCTTCAATGFLDVCSFCGAGNYTTLPKGYQSVKCSVCKDNAALGHAGMVDKGYEEKIYETRQDIENPYINKQEVISVMASLKYQFIDNIELYKLTSFSVINDAILGGEFYYSETMMPDVSAEAGIYTGDNAAFPEAAIAGQLYDCVGVTAYEDAHYYFADLQSKVIECENEEAYRARLSADKAEAELYLYENSWSRNDTLTIEIDNYEYTFMEDDIVEGCIVAGRDLDKSAADSIHAYGQAGVDITDFEPEKVVGEQVQKIISEDTGDLYTTGIKAEYDAVIGPDNSVVMYSGKGVFGSADNIYTHVFYPEGYGINHNGADPVDGYNIIIRSLLEPSIDILDNNLEQQTTPSTQLVTTMEDASYHLTLDSYYYVKLFTESSQERYVKAKMIRFPFMVYYDGIYYEPGEDGYTEWIEVKAPGAYDDLWDDNADKSNYESNNHWQMTPIYIPSWAEETDLEGAAQTISLKIIDKSDNEFGCDISVQLSGVIYGFTITGISDVGQYYGFDIDKAFYEMDFPAVCEKLEWIVGTRNRFGNYAYRYLLDGSITDNIKEYQTLPIRQGSGNGTDLAKTGSGEMAKGTAFNYVLRTITGLNGDNDYIEITPKFKYIMSDGTVVPDENLMIIYNIDDAYQIVGSDNEMELFDKYVIACDNGVERYSNMVAPAIGDLRFKDAYYDIEDTTEYHFGDWLTYTAKQLNKAVPVQRRIARKNLLEKQYFTNLFGYVRIPADLRVFCGEYEHLAVNQMLEGNELIRGTDFNDDGVEDSGFDETSFRNSMQMWFGSYKVWDEFYCIDISKYPEFLSGGLAVHLGTDPRVLKNGRLIIGFEIIAYKNGTPYLKYGDMWETEGQKTYYDGITLDYGDVAIVDTTKELSDNWNSGSFVIN